MSRIYDALKKMEQDRRSSSAVGPEPAQPVEFLQGVVPEPANLPGAPSVEIAVSGAARLVALTDPQGLGAEKFRALATRLENLRNQRKLKSLQITSSLADEGKTLIAANLATTFAKNSKNSSSKVLLIEGDLRRPRLASLFGLTDLRGTTHWWSGPDKEISQYIYRFKQMPLWFLAAGCSCDQPSNILQSVRFADALVRLVSTFDWIIVESTPLLPFADANLWSQLLDGMLLVVREGVASVKALKKGLEAIDNPNVIGIVLNDASDVDQGYYAENYVVPKQEPDQA